MISSQDKTIKNVKSLLLKGDVDTALDKLSDFISGIDSVLTDDILMLKQRYNRIEKANKIGTVSFEEYKLEINKITDSILYVIKQIPDSGEKKLDQKRGNNQGRLLHDIPLKMPRDLETKCTVRIAENEEVLLKNYQLSSDSQIEEIPISKIMEVELIDFDDKRNFNIRSFSSSEQTIEHEEYTQWLFFVKPINSGVHTLYLKVSIVQEIHGKERKKEIVLERKVNVVIDISEISNDKDHESWKDTNIIISTPDSNKKALKSKGLKKIRFLRFTLSLTTALIIAGTAIAGVSFLVYKILIKGNDKTQKEIKTRNRSDAGLPINALPIENDSTLLSKGVKSAGKNEENNLNKADPIKKEEKEIEFDMELVNPKQNESGNNKESKKSSLNVSVENKVEKKQVLDPKSESISYIKNQGYNIVDKLIPKDTSRIGAKILIIIQLSGFNKNKVEFVLNKKIKLKPTNIDGNMFYFEQIKSTRKDLLVKIIDKDSGNYIVKQLKGNTNYEWIVTRKVGSIGVD
jgi:hypothetical protein